MSRLLRQFATGFAFACFGVGGLLLRIVYFPLLGLLVRDSARRTRLARRAVQRSFAQFVMLMEGLGLIRVEFDGLDKLQRGGMLLLPNHPTLIDVVILMARVRNADCVVKASLARNPFTRGPVRACGYITNDAGPELIEACQASLAAGGNLVIFPEGTRTRPGEPLHLQRGAAQIAARLGRDVTPVLIRCEPRGLTKGQPWWRVADQALHFRLEVCDDVAIAPYLHGAAGEPSLAARRLNAYLRAVYSEIQGA